MYNSALYIAFVINITQVGAVCSHQLLHCPQDMQE